MANNVTAFLETLVGASGDYNAAKVGRLSFLDAVYLDVKPEIARAGKTIQVYFPDLGAFTEQSGNDWVPDDINPNYVDVVFNSRPGKAILVRDFDQWQTAVDIIDKFYDPAYKRGMEYFNGLIAAQITPTNFNVNPVIQGLSPSKVSVPDAARAWNALVGAKVPDDPDMMSLLTHNDVHAQMLQDAAWTQESLVSAAIAKVAREQADLGVAFNFKKRWDQQAPRTVPLTGGTPNAGNLAAGTLTPTDASAAVTGTGTHFTTDAPAFTNIVFTNDPTATVYRVKSVTSDTALTLATNYNANGFTVTAGTATAISYTSVAIHKYAIALAVRPLELVNDGTTHSRLVMLKGIPFRVQLSYQHLKGGWLMSIDCGCGIAVIRPDFGVIVKS